MTRLTSPRGVVVSVRKDKAAALQGQGYKPIETKTTKPTKEATGDDSTGKRGRRRGAPQARK